MTTRFEYKPAMLAQRQTVDVRKDGISLRKGASGRETLIRWDEIRSARFWTTFSKGTEFLGLDFVAENGTKLNLRATFGAISSAKSEVRRVYSEMTRAVFAAAAIRRPDLQIAIGTPPHMRWVMFIIGVFTLTFSTALPVAVVMDRRTDSMDAVVFPIAAMGFLGAILVWTNWPWRKPVLRSPQELLAAIAATDASDQR